jgi:hypothetical protein
VGQGNTVQRRIVLISPVHILRRVAISPPFNFDHGSRSQVWQDELPQRRFGEPHQGNPDGLSVLRCGPAMLLCRWESSQGYSPKALTGEASRHRAVENSRWTGHFASRAQLQTKNHKIWNKQRIYWGLSNGHFVCNLLLPQAWPRLLRREA